VALHKPCHEALQRLDVLAVERLQGVRVAADRGDAFDGLHTSLWSLEPIALHGSSRRCDIG